MKQGIRLPYATPNVKESPVDHYSASDYAERCTRTRRSALWAAYGDALGWISELTSAVGLERRTGGLPLREPIAWKRRIGGRGGITASLPKGCYSDDSQLRLATSRAIRPDGFDVEAFARVELPVWLSYGLGGGKSTSAAAVRLAKPRSSWWANSFKGWTKSGGNGAAMRVQPHVWAARTLNDPDSFIPDVVRNSICTHSHPRGLMGAVLHALCVARAVETGHCPSQDDLQAYIEVAERIPKIIVADTNLQYWRTAFERESGAFNNVWLQAISEARKTVQLVAEATADSSGAVRYEGIIDRLDLRNPSCRGSGTLTALAAVGLTWCEACPEEAVRIAANTLGTDTDTIATMAGAILGATAGVDPPVEVLDAKLFLSEADRLTEIAAGRKPPSHRYPDLLHWSAPKTRADALVNADRGYVVRGLGPVTESNGEPLGNPKGNFQWQWLKLKSGQTLLIKRRRKLPRERSDLGPHPARSEELPKTPDHPTALDLQKALSYVREHIKNNEKIGGALRRVVSKGTPGEIHEFTGKLIDLLQGDH